MSNVLKSKLYVPVVCGALVIVVAGYLLSISSTQVEAARRTIAENGDLYRASDVFGSKRFTENRNIRLLFEEKNDLLLVGKGLEGGITGSEVTNGTNLYLMRSDGSNERKVTNKLVDYAQFDQRGENIIYLTQDAKLYRYNITSQNNSLLAVEAVTPSLSPDGKSLLYEKTPPGWIPGDFYDGSPGFAILNLETSEEKIVPNTDAPNDYAPLWTPDGSHIIFFGNGGSHIINLDGTERTQLTNKEGAYADSGELIPSPSDYPLWSADGRYLVFHSDYVVWVVELDIPHKRLISARPIAEGVDPQWVEEGKTISVLAYDAKAGDRALAILDLDGNVIRGDRTRGTMSALIRSERIMPNRSPESAPDVLLLQAQPASSQELRREIPSAARRQEAPQEVPPNAVTRIRE